MRAAFYERLGEARDVLSIESVADPEPQPGEVRVRVAFSGINPTDVKSRGGVTAPSMAFPRIIPHNDGSGIIDRVGPGVDRSRIGQRVWIWNAQFRRAAGTAADYVCVPSRQAVPLPKEVSLQEGACLGVPALTAYRAVLMNGPVAGQTVLITGGAGAVGSYAVQFARLKGAKVISTASTDEKADYVRNLGASAVFDHAHDDLADKVMTFTEGRGVDRLVESEFGLRAAIIPRLLAPEGIVFVYGSARQPKPQLDAVDLMRRGITLHFRGVFTMPDQQRDAAIADIGRLLEQGRLRHRIGSVYPLEDIAAAHDAVERGAVHGKVLVQLSEEHLIGA